MTITDCITVRWLGQWEYQACWHAMQQYTNQRDADSPDEIWLLEHPPIFTQGQNGKPEHLLAPGNIPVIKTDRGGQVTFHGPGQLMIYTLIDIKRKKLNVREFVCQLERAVIDFLSAYGIKAHAKREAPGVYIAEKKLCSVGLRIRRGAAYHGMAFNVAMDLTPFQRINPCGYAALTMTQFADHGGLKETYATGQELTTYLMRNLGYNKQNFTHDYPEHSDGNQTDAR